MGSLGQPLPSTEIYTFACTPDLTEPAPSAGVTGTAVAPRRTGTRSSQSAEDLTVAQCHPASTGTIADRLRAAGFSLQGNVSTPDAAPRSARAHLGARRLRRFVQQAWSGGRKYVMTHLGIELASDI